MTQETQEAHSTQPRPTKAGANVFVELGPAILFMAIYNLARRADPANAIFIGTGVFMAATALALLYAWRVQKRLPPLLILTGLVVVIFGGLTLYFKDPHFAYFKPTILNGLFALTILGGLLVGKNPLKLLLGSALTLPEAVWRTLALRFAGYYVFLAFLNEFIWRSFSEESWVNFKVFGVFPITVLFILANTPLLSKHLQRS